MCGIYSCFISKSIEGIECRICINKTEEKNVVNGMVRL